MGKSWLDNEELFEQELQTGHRYAERVARELRLAALPVTVTPYQLREHVDRRSDFEDEYDLLIGRWRAEVKSRRVRFTGPRDFPYRTAFVYSDRGWRAKQHRPAAIILVSQETLGMTVVPASSERYWIARTVHDRVRDLDYTVLEIPRERLRSIEDFIEWLQVRC